jgi:hypothetical protein
MEATIEVSGLRKRFRQTVALDRISFAVSPGQVTGGASQRLCCIRHRKMRSEFSERGSRGQGTAGVVGKS